MRFLNNISLVVCRPITKIFFFFFFCFPAWYYSLSLYYHKRKKKMFAFHNKNKNKNTTTTTTDNNKQTNKNHHHHYHYYRKAISNPELSARFPSMLKYATCDWSCRLTKLICDNLPCAF